MAKDTFWVIVAQIIGIIGNMGLIVLLTNNLSKYDFGQFQLLITTVALSNVAALNGLNKSNLKGAAKGYDQILIKSLRLSLKFTLPLMLLALAFALYKYVFQEFDFFTLTVLAFGCFGVVYSFNLYGSYLNGKRKFFHARLFSVLIVVFRFLVLGVGSIWFKDVAVLILLDFGIQLLIAIIGMLYALSLADEKNKEIVDQSNEIKNLVRLGWGFTGLAGFNLLASKMEKIILGAIDPISLASYQVGALVPNTIKSNVKTFISVPISYWVKLEAKDNSIVITKYWYLLVGLGIASFIFVVIFLKLILTLFFSADYSSSLGIGYILSLSLGFIFFANIISNFFIYQGYERILYKISIGFSLLKISTYALVIPMYGIYGLIYSIVTIETLSFLVLLFLFLRVKDQLSQNATNNVNGI